MRRTIVFATGNEGKMREIRMVLADLGCEILSMKDAGILPGDYVIVHQCSTAENGAIVIALLEEEATCKRVRWERPEGEFGLRKLWLLPENEAYEPIDGASARILGQVVAVLRKYV